MSFAFCPRCDAKNPESTPACQACGAPMTQGTMVMTSVPTVARPKVVVRIVRADGGPETQVPMTGDILVCGQTGHIALRGDPFVAPSQARLFFSGPKLAIEDVGGGNGVFQRLKAAREVPTGGELRLGRQRLIVEPVPTAAPGAGGTPVWGSPDVGYRFLLVQVLEGGLRGAAFPLKEGDNLLGREVGDITFPGDGFVSGKHAVLQVRQDRLVVRDVGSSNGTFVRLGSAMFVEHNDHFLIGRELIKVELSA